MSEYGMVGWHHHLDEHKPDKASESELVMDREAWHAAVHGSQRVQHDLVPEQQQGLEYPWDINVRESTCM